MLPSTVDDLILVGDRTFRYGVGAFTGILISRAVCHAARVVCRALFNFTPSPSVITLCILAVQFVSLPPLYGLVVRSWSLLIYGAVFRPVLMEVFDLIEWVWYVVVYVAVAAILAEYGPVVEILKQNGWLLALIVAWSVSMLAVSLLLSYGSFDPEHRPNILFTIRVSAAVVASGFYTLCWIAFRLLQFWQAWVESHTRRHAGKLSDAEARDFEASQRPYEYAALDPTAGEIRLLRLRKATPFSRVTCAITMTPLNAAPPYEAISYTWAGQRADHYITLKGDRRLKVTENAFNIIHETASFLKPRYVWIDAICINQSDPEEKQCQVEMMGQIYHTAWRALVWLGNRHAGGGQMGESPELPSAATTEEATLMLNLLQELRHLAYSLHTSPQKGETAIEDSVKGTRADWVAIMRFFCNPYWNRAWIVQEIALARRVSILYGGYYIDWTQLTSFFEIATYKEVMGVVAKKTIGYKLRVDQVEHGATRQVLLLSTIRDKMSRTDLFGIVEAMNVTRLFEATDPRDKVYALYALIALEQKITPDYNLSAEEVYLKTAQIFHKTKPYSMLEFAGIGYQRRSKSLPSWVPDWTKPPAKDYTLNQYDKGSSRYRAGGSDTLLHVEPINDMNLRLQIAAVPIQQLRMLGQPYSIGDMLNQHVTQGTSMGPLAWVCTTALLLEITLPPIYPRTGQTRRETIWRTLIGDHGHAGQGLSAVRIHPAPARYSRVYALYEKLIISAAPKIDLEAVDTDGSPLSGAEAILDFNDAVFNACCARRVAITDDMTVALVPELAEEEDWLCVMPGWALPIILRKLPDTGNNTEETWQFVGECYAHGLMAGEAIEMGLQSMMIMLV